MTSDAAHCTNNVCKALRKIGKLSKQKSGVKIKTSIWGRPLQAPYFPLWLSGHDHPLPLSILSKTWKIKFCFTVMPYTYSNQAIRIDENFAEWMVLDLLPNLKWRRCSEMFFKPRKWPLCTKVVLNKFSLYHGVQIWATAKHTLLSSSFDYSLASEK